MSDSVKIDITPEDSVVPVYLVEQTAEDLKELEDFAKQERLKIKNEELAEQERLKNIESALQKLAKLGLTEDEAKAIAGV